MTSTGGGGTAVPLVTSGGGLSLFSFPPFALHDDKNIRTKSSQINRLVSIE
jgi:hypothetical protein